MSKRTCKVCQTKYEAKKYWQKYCSKSCKQAAWAIRKFKKGKANVDEIK